MSYILKTKLANRSNYGSRRAASDIKYIVIHYTSNDGDTDENNGDYFKNNITKSSANYFVDSDSITQVVPDDYIAYHCGAKRYKHPECRNKNSLGIELCDDVKNGSIYPSKATIDNAVELVKSLMIKYGIEVTNVIRHYDVTGKMCPLYWCGNIKKDALWESEFLSKITAAPYSTMEHDTSASDGVSLYVTAKSGLKIRNASADVIEVLPFDSRVMWYGYYTVKWRMPGKWLYVKCLNGKTGYISSQYVQRQE